jgi:hypothetical protein
MAHMPGDPRLGFTERGRGAAGSVADDTSSVATPANYASEAALDARLTAISATSYSAERLRNMTHNDKVYAVRLNDDAASI